jgi:hypothetical protein
MAVLARHFGYKPVTQTYNFPGYTEHGARLVVQDNYITPFQGGDEVPGQQFAGFEWTMGPDEDRFHSIICYTAEINGELPEAFNTEGTIDTASYVPGDVVEGYGFDGTARKLAFKGVPTQADFLGIANELGIGTFANDAEAVAAINNTTLGAWTNYDGVNSNQGDEGGNKENPTPTDYYYEVTACGGSTIYILKTSSSDLIRFNAYEANEVLISEGLVFDAETYVVVRSTSAQAHQLLDTNPTIGNCEA